MSEHLEQVALFDYAGHKWWGEMMFAIPNGGNRHIVTAKKLKAEGVKSGVPDIFLAIPKWTLSPNRHIIYTGLFIEMKFGKNKLSENQRGWVARLKYKEYRVAVCYGFDEAKKVIEQYLEG